MPAISSKCSTSSVSQLDPFLHHVNKELKEKEIQAVATNPKTTHELKVSVVWSSQSRVRKALSKAVGLGFLGLPKYRTYISGGGLDEEQDTGRLEEPRGTQV